MLLTLLKSKIHCAVVTEANLQYMGSITIDSDLMRAAHILPNERVQVVNNNNGTRLETYVIPGKAGSGVICLNGAAARLVQPNDIVIIMAYVFMQQEEAKLYQPLVVMVDAKNKIKEIRHIEYESQCN
jgi:aspartate 1-decarboxylase